MGFDDVEDFAGFASDIGVFVLEVEDGEGVGGEGEGGDSEGEDGLFFVLEAEAELAEEVFGDEFVGVEGNVVVLDFLFELGGLGAFDAFEAFIHDNVIN